MTSVIQLDKISKKYDTSSLVLNEISYTFEEGQFYGIVGPSGAGKTTLLNLLGILDNVTSGEIFILNKRISCATAKEKALIRNRHIGFVFQSFFLNKNLTAIENVMLPLLITNQSFSQCQKKAEALLSDIGLEKRLTHFPNQLSGGEQQRIAIARALVTNPDIIIADEPTGNLDPQNEEKIMHIFLNLAKQTNKTIIMATHNNTLLSEMDHLLKLDKGILQKL